jgi:hypothetical protein
VECQNRQHFEAFVEQMRSQGSEGVILRDPKAWYFKPDAFFKKDLLESTLVMKVEEGSYRWFVCCIIIL